MTLIHRRDIAVEIAAEAAAQALGFFREQDKLLVDTKGMQDYVSQADREVEHTIRARLDAAFPDDAIVGEEHAPTPGRSGFTWVIDPIDGTANFVTGIPAWCVVLAGVRDGRIQTAVICDPCHGETFIAAAGHGATLNGAPMRVQAGRGLAEGTVGIGYSGRVPDAELVELIRRLLAAGARFQRTASGALSLAWVAAGRYLGYVQGHMHPWDCLAGQLLIAEAGGRVEPQDADRMVARGGRVVAGSPEVFDALVEIADQTFSKSD